MTIAPLPRRKKQDVIIEKKIKVDYKVRRIPVTFFFGVEP